MPENFEKAYKATKNHITNVCKKVTETVEQKKETVERKNCHNCFHELFDKFYDLWGWLGRVEYKIYHGKIRCSCVKASDYREDGIYYGNSYYMEIKKTEWEKTSSYKLIEGEKGYTLIVKSDGKTTTRNCKSEEVIKKVLPNFGHRFHEAEHKYGESLNSLAQSDVKHSLEELRQDIWTA